MVRLTTLSTERLCNELEQWLASTSFISFTTTSLAGPMPRTTARRHRPPFALPCNAPARSVAGRRAADNVDTRVRDQRKQRQPSRLYKRRRLGPSALRAQLCKAAGQHRVPVAWAFAASVRGSQPPITATWYCRIPSLHSRQERARRPRRRVQRSSN